MGKIAKVEPGWLERTLRSARLQTHYKFLPSDLVNMGHQVTLPIENDEAEELYAKMNAHFKAWTGKDLKSFK